MKQLAASGAARSYYDQCVYGNLWRKSTTLLAWNCPSLQDYLPRCRGSIRKWSVTGLPHMVLKGKHEGGCYMTKLVESYPIGLCNNISKMFATILNNDTSVLSALSTPTTTACGSLHTSAGSSHPRGAKKLSPRYLYALVARFWEPCRLQAARRMTSRTRCRLELLPRRRG